jgi:23S rRNA pseudouridine1911/1915/1917 synthase
VKHELPTEFTTFEIPADLHGQRLDRALVRLLPGVSRTRLQELIRDGGVRLAGECVTRPAQEVETGQQLAVVPRERSRVRPGGPAGAELVVLHEDEHLAVVDKPPGMVAHPSSVVRGGTVSELAVRRYGELPAPQGEDRPGIVHRLDADTSGVMLIARTAAAADGLMESFRERAVEKTYLALVYGDPRFDSDWIEQPIGRASERSDRMGVVEEGEGLEAVTFYTVRERFGVAALVEARPKTGRTHQIRVHLAWIDHPVLADSLYRRQRGAVQRLPEGAPPLGRHALHAQHIALTHPVTGARLDVEAPLPRDMDAVLAWLRASRADEA